MQVKISPREGSRGDLVKIQVNPDNPSQVASVSVVVDYGFYASLRRNGDEWIGEERVPYEADSGTYRLVLRAYDNASHPVEVGEETFTVRN